MNLPAARTAKDVSGGAALTKWNGTHCDCRGFSFEEAPAAVLRHGGCVRCLSFECIYIREKQQRLLDCKCSLHIHTHTNIHTTNKPETIRTINKTSLARHSLNGVGRMPADKFQHTHSQCDHRSNTKVRYDCRREIKNIKF